MKHIVISAAVVLAGALWPGKAVLADNPHGATAEGATAKTTAESTPQPANCVRDTGTRIKAADGGCLSGVPGRSYGHDELQSTGAVDAGDALRKLNTDLTVNQH